MAEFSLDACLSLYRDLQNIPIAPLGTGPDQGLNDNPGVLTGAQSRDRDRIVEFVGSATALLIAGVGLKQIASKMPNGQVKNELSSAIEQAIGDWEDGICPPPPFPPRPFPSILLAVSLSTFAATLQAGALQAGIRQEAERVARRAVGETSARHATATL